MVERSHVIAVGAHNEQTDGDDAASPIKDAAAHDPLLECNRERTAKKRQERKRTGGAQWCSEPRIAQATFDRIGSVRPRLVAANALGADHGTIRLDGFMNRAIDQAQ